MCSAVWYKVADYLRSLQVSQSLSCDFSNYDYFNKLWQLTCTILHTEIHLILIGKKQQFFFHMFPYLSGILYTVVSFQFYQAFIVQIFFISTPLMVLRLFLWAEGKHLHHFKICYLDI